MSPAQVKSDFVNVRLANAGRNFAGPNGSVRIANAHMDYKFSGDAAQRVLSSEWMKVLSVERCDGGGPMFELVPDAQTAPASVAKPTTVPQPIVAEATQEK